MGAMRCLFVLTIGQSVGVAMRNMESAQEELGSGLAMHFRFPSPTTRIYTQMRRRDVANVAIDIAEHRQSVKN